jgi:hypothetical protein
VRLDYGSVWTDSGWGPAAGACEHGNEPSGSTKGGEFLEYYIFVIDNIKTVSMLEEYCFLVYRTPAARIAQCYSAEQRVG